MKTATFFASLTIALGLAMARCSSSSDGGSASGGDSGAGSDTGGGGGGGGGGDDGGTTSSDSGGGGGGDDGSTLPPDGGGDSGAGGFALTSTELAEGATFGVDNTCDGANTSPPFAWTGAPSGAKSFAIVLTDKTNSLVHWTIYDIGAQTTSTPADIEAKYQPADPAGSKQAKSIKNAPVYAGPCPPKGTPAHSYEFSLYAVDVDTLPATNANTTKEQIVTLLGAHKVAVTTLNGKYGR